MKQAKAIPGGRVHIGGKIRPDLVFQLQRQARLRENGNKNRILEQALEFYFQSLSNATP